MDSPRCISGLKKDAPSSPGTIAAGFPCARVHGVVVQTQREAAHLAHREHLSGFRALLKGSAGNKNKIIQHFCGILHVQDAFQALTRH